MEQKTITAQSHTALDLLANEYMRAGWTPLGSPFILPTSLTETHNDTIARTLIAQTLIRYKTMSFSSDTHISSYSEDLRENTGRFVARAQGSTIEYEMILYEDYPDPTDMPISLTPQILEHWAERWKALIEERVAEALSHTEH